MTTSNNTGGRHWLHYLRFLAPGPLALGMHGYFPPTVWRVRGDERDVAHPQQEDEGLARRVER